MIRAAIIILALVCGTVFADQIRIDWREGTTGNFAPRNLTTLEGYVLTFDSNGNPVIGPGGTGTGMPDLPASRLLGRGASGGTGIPEAITLGPGLALTGTTLDVVSGGEVSLDALPDGQEIRGATVASIIIGAGKGVGETTILAPWDVDGAVDGAPRITMTSGNSPTLAIDSPTVSWGDGIKQVFNPSATTAGLNAGGLAGDPSALVNGDLWYDSTANELTARINGANVALGAGGGGGIAAGDSPTWTGAHTFTRAGAASAPTISLTGAPFTGGDATTTKPLLLLEPTGTPSAAWNTAGTMLGINGPVGFAGHLLNLQIQGINVFRFDAAGNYTSYGGATIGGAINLVGALAMEPASLVYWNGGDLVLGRIGAQNLRVGNNPTAAPAAQALTIGEASRPGTDSNIGGANGTIQSGLGTGTGTASSLIFQTPTVAASGSTVQTQTTRLTLSSAGAEVPTETYDASGWDNDLSVPTKDAVRDKIEALGGGSEAKGYITSNQLTASGTAVNATGMSFAVAASEVWSFEFYLAITNEAGGSNPKFALDVPTAATIGAQVRGTTSTASYALITADATLTVGVMNAVSGGVVIAGLVQNGANAGSVQLQFASGDGINDTSLVGGSTYFVARKMN